VLFQITAGSNRSARTQVNRVSCTPKSLPPDLGGLAESLSSC
jgi:hypothetical protein